MSIFDQVQWPEEITIGGVTIDTGIGEDLPPPTGSGTWEDYVDLSEYGDGVANGEVVYLPEPTPFPWEWLAVGGVLIVAFIAFRRGG